MEFSLKTISHFIEPIIALIMPFLMAGINFGELLRLNTLTVEEKSRVLMAVMFALFYFVKTIRKYELKDELDNIKKRLDKLEKPNATQPAAAR